MLKKKLKVKKNHWKNAKRFPPFPCAQLLCAIYVSVWLFLTAECLDTPHLVFILGTTDTSTFEDPVLQIAMQAKYPGSQVDWHKMYWRQTCHFFITFIIQAMKIKVAQCLQIQFKLCCRPRLNSKGSIMHPFSSITRKKWSDTHRPNFLKGSF